MMNIVHPIRVSHQSDILIEIEQLVQKIIALPRVMPWNSDHQENITFYKSILNALPRLLSVYLPRYSYSQEVRLFWQVCLELGLLQNTELNYHVVPDIEQVKFMVDVICLEADKESFRRGRHDRLYQTGLNYKRLCDYATSLHKRYSRLLVVRVDLYYSQEAQQNLMIDDALAHFDKMICAKYTRMDIFDHLVGCIWRAEQGETRGYHFHMAYYFLGVKHQNDWFKATQIGELWVAMTERLGTYHSCNTTEEKQKYKNLGLLGVGMIHRDNPEEVKNAINAVGYLAKSEKDDQYLRMKPKNRREFATGMPIKAKAQHLTII